MKDSENIKPEPFTDSRVGYKYTSGPYGNEKITSFRSVRFRKNEWAVIPEDHKKELVDWINSKLDLDSMLYDQSLKFQSTNPVTEYLVQEGVLPDIDAVMSNEEIESLPENQDVPKEAIYTNQEARHFMKAFLHHKKNSEISLIFQPKRFKLGFVVNDYEEIHFISFATLHPIWRPDSQTDLAEMTKKEKLKSPQKNDEQLDKMFRTTVRHSFGMHWAGILTLNIPKVSTIINGIQHALKLPTASPRYRIEWINLKNPRDRTEVLYESSELTSVIDNCEIEETDGSEKVSSYINSCLAFSIDLIKNSLESDSL